jgi:YfiH family protein
VPRVLDVDLGARVAAWFTGRGEGPDPAVGRAGNLSARRPHQPTRLAADRRAAFGRHGVRADDVHLMRQVHGTRVAVVDARTPTGAVLPDVDALVTREVDRPLAVLTADCLPVLLAGPTTVAVAHAGRRGLLAGVLEATVAACEAAGDAPSDLGAVVGPAIHGCCYEVPAGMQDEVAATHPDAVATTAWGTPSLDLPRVARRLLEQRDVVVDVVSTCTRCDADAWFSHRADPDAGRQAGVVVRVAEGVAA